MEGLLISHEKMKKLNMEDVNTIKVMVNYLSMKILCGRRIKD